MTNYLEEAETMCLKEAKERMCLKEESETILSFLTKVTVKMR